MSSIVLNPQRGVPINIKTDRFIVRSLTTNDALGSFRMWIANPALMAALNMPARNLSKSDLARFIAGYDDRVRYLLGVFSRGDRSLIAVFTIDVTPAHARLKVSGFIGDRNWLGKEVTEEVSVELFEEFFKKRGIEKAVAQVEDRNFGAIVPLRRMGFRVEGLLRSEIRAFDGSGRRNQFILGLVAADWKHPHHEK
jgi:RimJ/RimL family protein N-acetyltransferase